MPEGARPDPPNGTFRVACSGLYPPTHWTNVFHLKITSTGEPDLDDLDAVLDAVNTAYVTNLLPVLSTNVEYQGAEGVYFGASGPIRLTADSTGSGAVSDAVALPANVAVGISWKIAASYRGGHPRTYLVGIDSDQIADVQRLTPAAQLLYQAAASAFRGDMQTIAPGAPITDVAFGTVSYVLDGEWRATPVFRPFIGESVDYRLDTQRRRLGRDVSV